jgi:hypothetical protein
MFLYYYNPRPSIASFLRLTTWFSNLPEADKFKLMHAFHTTLVNLRVEDASSLDITSYDYGYGETKMAGYRGGPPIMFLGPFLPKFLMQLLRTFYPALGNRIHCKLLGSGGVDCVFGDSRDPSPEIPTLYVQPTRPRGPNERALNLKFRANAAWIASRQDDLRAFLGGGHIAIAMSLHCRLGSKIDCLLGKLQPEVLRIIVNLLDS